MKKNLFILLLSLCSLAIQAQDDTKQVLVFRHSGAVDLFYHEQLDSIFCSNIDTLGVEHDGIVSQIFYTKDSTYVIPIADIDSVVFGNRNEIEFKQEVKVLTEEDMSWIIRVENNIIYYKPNTPATILPRVGDKLFYPEITEMFPVGLSVSVTDVTPQTNEIAVTIEAIDLAEIFERFFYAGQIEQTVPAGIHKAPQFSADLKIQGKVNIGSYGSISANGGVKINGIAVIQPLRNYYHVEMDVNPHVGFDMTANIQNPEPLHDEKELWYQVLPSVGMLFVPHIECYLFYELNASMKFNYEMQRNFHQSIIWTRQNGQNIIEQPDRGHKQTPTDHAKIDVILDGSFYCGVGLNIYFALIGEVAGARAATRIGPEFSGNISVGLLRNLSLSDYNSEVYASGKLTVGARLAFAANLYHREGLIWGSIVHENPFISANFRFWQHTINLFPEYKSSRAVREIKNDRQQQVSVVTRTDTELARPLETGFQLLKPNAEVAQTDFVQKLKEETPEVQGVAAVIEVPNSISPDESIDVRPVFKYDGYTIPYASVGAAQEPGVMPITTYMSKDLVTIISGAAIIGQVTEGSTTLHIGNYLPVPYFDPLFVPFNPYIATGIPYISNNNPLCGTWEGQIDDISTILIMKEDYTGSMIRDNVEKTFSYTLNTPNDGNLLLLFDDTTTRSFSIKSVSALYLVLRDKENNTNYKLTKKHSYEIQ